MSYSIFIPFSADSYTKNIVHCKLLTESTHSAFNQLNTNESPQHNKAS